MRFDREHALHYSIIVGIVLMGIGLAFVFAENTILQFFGVVFASAIYLSYGILHHRLSHDLTIKIVVEYVLVALLVVSLFIFVKAGSY